MPNLERTEMPTGAQVAKRSMKLLGVRRTEKAGSTNTELSAGDEQALLVAEAYDLFAERIDLRDGIVRRERALMEPVEHNRPDSWQKYEGALGKVEAEIEAQTQLTLNQKRELVRAGRINQLVATIPANESSTETIKKSQVKVREIEDRLDQIFADPKIYDAFQQDLSHQIDLRRQAREVVNLDKFTKQADLLALRLARQAQVEGRPLTAVERQIITDNQELRAEVTSRSQELTRDPEVFDEARLLQLLEYRRQLHQTGGKFVETPTRREYIDTLEKLWADGQKVLATGATGTGKTELVRFARNQMFGFEYAGDKFELTGHKDMTPYELLGRTGFSMKNGQGGDVYRPSKLIQAMIAKDKDGNLAGAPFLYDEMDASPNEANIALKTILNDGPGDAVSVQMDTQEKFSIGPNYSFTATANVKSEKHQTRFEIDPAIVRVLEPMVINYLPPWEVWDIAIASQMDRRGKISLSQEDATVTLKALCDAAYWTQQAYRGERVATGKNTFLDAKGGATSGKPATLKEGVLDPGRVIRMLKGWEASSAEGKNLRDFLNEQIVRFINNENYPEDDRYYLTEIFALQGFLKDTKANELMVPGLTQGVLDRWIGSTKKSGRKARKEAAYLTADAVSRLDPYKRLARPATEEAKELLEELEGGLSAETTATRAEWERAQEILGQDFLGPEAIEKTFGISIDAADIPEIPFSEEELETAHANGGYLVLRVDKKENGKPLTLEEMVNMLQPEFDTSNKGKILYDTSWYQKEPFFKSGTPRPGWRLVTKTLIPSSTSKNYLQQTEAIVDYLRGTVFASEPMPAEFEDAINEFENQKADIGKILSSDWKKAADRLARLQINHMTRQTLVESRYDFLMYMQNNNERLLEDKYAWTCTQASVGTLVGVGYSNAEGAGVNGWLPGSSDDSIGVVLSR